MDPFIYRECRATITARIPDTPDADAHPDRVLVQGRGTAHPQFQGGSVVFTEIGEYAIPQPVPVVIVDGELLVEVLSGDESVETQPLFLPVTVDERANQNWSWRLTFDFLTLGEHGEEVSHPPLSFPVEAGDGPLEISTVATPIIKSKGFVTRGPRGFTVTSVTAQNGELTFAWEDGSEHSVPMPESVPGPPGPKGDPGTIAYEGVEPIVVDGKAVTVGGVGVITDRGQIPDGTDINTIRDPGIYLAPSTAAVATYTNWPSIRAGSLVVARTAGGNAVTQTVVCHVSTSAYAEQYYRGSVSSLPSGWGPWTVPDWVKGLSNQPKNVDTFRDAGAWGITDRGAVTGLPGTGMGVLEVIMFGTSTGLSLQRFTERIANDNVKVWSRYTLTASGWAGVAWSSGGDKVFRGEYPTGASADTFTNAGVWSVGERTGTDGLPSSSRGVLEVLYFGATYALQRFTERSAVPTTWVRTSISSTFTGEPWTAIGPSSGGGEAPTAARTADVDTSSHSARVGIARSRRGGGTGTGGRPVFMWRFDHWLVAFRDKILPILREFDLPATLNVNHDNMGLDQNGSGSITWDHVQEWNQYHGIEIANHGSTHTNPSNMEGIYHEIVNGRRNLEAAMPRVAVETWQEHGSAYLVAADLDGDTGLDLGRTPEAFTESYAGRLVMAEHAVVEGKTGSFYPPLTGHPQIGQSHYSLDRDTAESAIDVIKYAQTLGRGLTGYTHPGLMDGVNIGGSIYYATYYEDGTVGLDYNGGMDFQTEQELRAWAAGEGHIVHMPVKDFRTICEWLAAERDAGRLMVMTAAGGAFADKSHDRRENLLVNPEFAGNLTGQWSFTSGWTFSDGTATSGATATALSQAMLLYTRFGWAMGAAHEMVVNARADTPTTLTLSMEQLGNPANWKTERIFEIPGDGVARDYRLNLSLPRDRNVSQMRIYLGGPNLTITRPPLLAAI